ncbi:glycosyltransferase family 2 protein [Aurantimonas sp. A2-1-M11]|uniref:glycosyltransferase family 2 protein n=1 Tax=Aurantimonas sp. A2-1-M11 TaxID=3113712 RepID=UPI002F95845C
MSSVDVAIPCYNYGRFLRDCVGSVVAQAGVDVRVLIIDNCSTDDSLSVARQLKTDDRRVDVVEHASNRGATFSYNEGIDWAASDYFLILDADDLLAPGALARAMAVLDAHPEIGFTHGIEARLGPGGPGRPARRKAGRSEWVASTGAEFIERLCATPVNNIGANTVVRRTAAQKSIGYYRPTLPYTDDLEMWLRLATTGGVASIRAVQAIRRDHDARMSIYYEDVILRDFTERQAAFESFFANEGRFLADAPQLLARAKHGLGAHAYWSAVSHICRGDRARGLQLLRFAHQRRPRAAHLPPLRWLLQMDRPAGRMMEIASDALGSWVKGTARR